LRTPEVQPSDPPVRSLRGSEPVKGPSVWRLNQQRSIYAAKQKQLIQQSKRQEEQARAILTLYKSDEYHEEIERAKQTLVRIAEERLQWAKIAVGSK
jgi:predicted RNA-binding protein YlxR (DUF448 family)